MKHSRLVILDDPNHQEFESKEYFLTEICTGLNVICTNHTDKGCVICKQKRPAQIIRIFHHTGGPLMERKRCKLCKQAL